MQETEREWGDKDLSTFEENDSFGIGLLHCVMWPLIGWGLKDGFFIV